MSTLGTTTAVARGRTLEVSAVGAIGAVVGVTALGVSSSGVGATIVVVLLIASVAAGIDARTGRIPDRLVALAGLAVATGVVVGIDDPHGVSTIGVLAGTLGFAGPLFLCHLAAPASVGFGDVKLAAVAGAALGLVDGRLGLVALCVATGTTAVVGIVGRRSELPLGPGLVLGAAVAVVTAPWVWM